MTNTPHSRGFAAVVSRAVLATLFVFVGFVSGSAFAQEKSARQEFDIPAGEAKATLKQFAAAVPEQLLFSSEAVSGVRTNALKGRFTAEEGLDRLLANTGLVADHDDRTKSFAVRKETEAEAKNDSSRPANDRAAGEIKDGVLKLDTFEVMGSKLLNMDKPRSVDDPQPYVLFDRNVIERSGATNLGDFFKQRLTMNTVGQTGEQFGSIGGGTSGVNLRGLGANQTLILVDGHRLPARVINGQPGQPDINGIPLLSIERIEVLPTTASGIYGGTATGGVINIILRRDYAGAELSVTYGNTFESDAATRRVDLSAGYSLEGGKTHVLLSASYTDKNALLLGDRDFVQRSRARILANNPAFLLGGFNPPLGFTTNIRSSNGSPLFGPGTSNFTSVPIGYSGGAGLAPFLPNAGKYNLDLANGTQPNAGRNGLSGEGDSKSLILTMRREFTKSVQAFLDLSDNERRDSFGSNPSFGFYTVAATAPNNPFGQAIRVAVPATAPQLQGAFSTSSIVRRAVGGLIIALPAEWKSEIDYSLSESVFRYVNAATPTTSAVGTAISNGSFDVLLDLNKFPPNLSQYLGPIANAKNPSSTTVLSLRAGGPVGKLFGVAPTVSILLERTKDTFRDGFSYRSNAPATPAFQYYGSSQTADSAYGEVLLPIIEPKNEETNRGSLKLQLAGRYDKYNIDAAQAGGVAYGTVISRNQKSLHSSNPTVALLYSPTHSLTMRASFGTGFLPPAVGQLVPRVSAGNTYAGILTDPLRGNEDPSQIVTTTEGGNPNLVPEKSKTYSAGVILKPAHFPGVRVSIDYNRIEKKDNIVSVLDGLVASLGEAITNFPDAFTRGPVPPGDPYGVGPLIAANFGYLNATKSFSEAFDIEVDSNHDFSGVGAIDLTVGATWQTHYKVQLTPSSPFTDRVGVGANGNPSRLKANGSIVWNKGPWIAGWNTTFFHSYLVSLDPAQILAQGNGGRVPSQLVHDVFVKYNFGVSNLTANTRTHSWLRRMEIQVNVSNVFNTRPEVDVSNTGSSYSWYVDPRLARYAITVKTRF